MMNKMPRLLFLVSVATAVSVSASPAFGVVKERVGRDEHLGSGATEASAPMCGLGLGCATDADCGPTATSFRCPGSCDGREIKGLHSKGAAKKCVEHDTPVCFNGCCKCKQRGWFFILVGVYLMSMLTIAMVARYSAPDQEEDTTKKTDGDVEDDGSGDLRQHFMASGNFGPAVLALTLFSTTFSGYTVVGVPAETAAKGWGVAAWMGLMVWISISQLLFTPRLRQVGTKRLYSSPTDIIGDRFDSEMLRIITAISLTFPLFIYTTVQFVSMVTIVDALALGRLNAKAMAIVMCVVIIVCEWVGGQRSVTLSDAIQGVIMIVAFIMMPFAIHHQFGSLASHFDTAGCHPKCAVDYKMYFDRTPTTFGKCPVDYYLDELNDVGGYDIIPTAEAFAHKSCMASTLMNNGTHFDPSYAEDRAGQVLMATAKAMDHGGTKTWDRGLLYIISMFLGTISFALQPHLVQKIFVADSDASLKRAQMLMQWAPFITFLPGIYYGFMRVSAFAHVPSTGSSDALPVVAGQLMDKGGFSNFLAIFTCCSIIAAIMSTADSTIIGANNVVTVELVDRNPFKKPSAKFLRQFSIGFTPVFTVAAMLFAFKAKDLPLLAFVDMQNTGTWQALPTYVCACYTDKLSAHALFYGQFVGLIVALTIIGTQMTTNEETGLLVYGYKYYMSNGERVVGADFGISVSLVGGLTNMVVTVLAQLVMNAAGSSSANDDTRTWDRTRKPGGDTSGWRGQPRLTASHITTEIMKKSKAPLEQPLGQALVGLALVLTLLGLPLFTKPYTQQGSSNGILSWAQGYIAIWVIAVVLLNVATSLWVTEEGGDDAPEDDAMTIIKRRASSAKTTSSAKAESLSFKNPVAATDDAYSI